MKISADIGEFVGKKIIVTLNGRRHGQRYVGVIQSRDFFRDGHSEIVLYTGTYIIGLDERQIHSIEVIGDATGPLVIPGPLGELT